MTNNNPILDELHATREKLLEEAGGTVAGLVAKLRAEQKASGRKILPTQRSTHGNEAMNSAELDAEKLSSPPDEN